MRCESHHYGEGCLPPTRESSRLLIRSLNESIWTFFLYICPYRRHVRGNFRILRAMNLNNVLNPPECTPWGWPCYLCPKYFTQKSNLTKHVDGVHKKKRPHVCADCKASFQTSWHLDRHRRSLHSGKEFSCARCTSTFSTKSSLSKHRNKRKNDRTHWVIPRLERTF